MAESISRFYALEPQGIRKIGEEEFQDGGVRVGYLTLEDLRRVSEKFGFADRLDRDFTEDPARLRNSIDVYADCTVGIIHIVNMADLEGARDRIAFVAMKGLFLLAEIQDENGSVLKMFEDNVQRFSGGAPLEKFIYGILERLLTGSGHMLEDMEKEIMEIELRLLGDEADRSLNRTIYAYRKNLSLAHNYLEQLIDLAEELEENENELFDRKNLWHFRLFIGKAERLSRSIQAMGESAVHLRESLDAVMNYNLNRIMKVLTVITAIFMPLTLIVGWYGMNFKHMPELNHPLAYPTLALVFLAVIILIVMVFKRKKYM